MRSLFIAFLVIGLVGTACGQPSKQVSPPTLNASSPLPTLAITQDSARYFFEGTIGDKARITATIAIDNDNDKAGKKSALLGYYRYLTGKYELSLQGMVQPNFTFTMTERNDQNRENTTLAAAQLTTGRWAGTLDRASGKLSGTWTSGDGKKTFPFMLQATARYIELKHKTKDIHFSYPVFARPELKVINDSIARIAAISYRESERMLDTLRNEILSDTTNSDNPDFRKATLDNLSDGTDMTVVYASSKLVSTLWNTNSYIGGAHGNFGYVACTWRIENGRVREVILKELFQPNVPYQNVIATQILAKLRAQQASLVVNGEVDLKGMLRLINDGGMAWSVHPSGITFHFSPYIVGSYAEGTFDAHVSWKSLQTVLRKDGVVKEFVP
jgi:Deacetylase PdaC/Protein of unknown function (DUF3298)